MGLVVAMQKGDAFLGEKVEHVHDLGRGREGGREGCVKITEGGRKGKRGRGWEGGMEGLPHSVATERATLVSSYCMVKMEGQGEREGGREGGREDLHTHTLREGGKEGGRTYPIAGLCGNSERHVGFLLLHRKDRGESLCC